MTIDTAQGGTAAHPQGTRALAEDSTDTLLERITRQLPLLRRSEQRVATIVLDNPVGVVHFTMAGLAEAAEVSEPTVMRFCASVGCEGFQDFKIQLAQTLALGLPVTHSSIGLLCSSTK